MENGTPATRARRSRPTVLAAAVCLLLAGALLAPVATVRAADRPIIAVADFYSPGALPIFVVTDPESYAADALTGFLVPAGGNALTVLPRGEVRVQERTLGWHSHDALSYNRLGALAQALRADRLMLGWITRVSVFRQDILAFNGYATLTMQMFDARQGRIVWQRETDGFGLGGTPDLAVQIAVERALAHGVDAAAAAASAPVDRTTPAP